MEGAELFPWLFAIVAIVALVLALAALVLVSRLERGTPDGSVASARLAEIERRVLQSARRLEALEHEVDVAGTSRERESEGPDVREDASLGSGTRDERSGRSGSAVSHIGLVRFDAFDDTGGGQSFALALIDEAGHGVVLTSLHSRQTTRLYVKDIRAGVADAPLSTEEERALREAGVAT